ncbi:MAG: energy transducer TonB [Paludibacter sp.]|nr:energy transducer TonB [Paludibacter sp.]
MKCFFSYPAVIVLFALLFSFTGNASASQFKNIHPTIDQTDTKTSQDNAKDSVYNFVDKMPQFPGGEKEVVAFLSKTMVYPEEAMKKNEHGKVVVQFVIGKTGKVENAKVLRGVSKELDAEALRVVGLLPDWTPGEQNGEKVAVYRIIPILFQSTTPEDAWQINDKTVVVINDVKMPNNFNTGILNLDKIATVSILKPFPKEVKSKLISKYGKMAENGVLLITSNKHEIQYSLPDSTLYPPKAKDPNCKEEAIMPSFPGGEDKLLGTIADSIQYPFVAKRTKTQGKVYVRFMVDVNGKISDVTAARSIDYFLGKEAVRVIKSLPDWTPATQCGKKMNIMVTMPVIFKLDLPAADKKDWVRNDKTIVLLDGERLPASFDLEWLRYENLSSYQVLQPTSKEAIKKLKSQYGRDAENGVILIGSRKLKEDTK